MPVSPIALGTFSQLNANKLLVGEFIIHTTGTVINPLIGGRHMVTATGVLAMTLAAPLLVDDGLYIRIESASAFAHTLTATGLLQTGSAAVNVATFAAFAGAGLTLMAFNQKWQVIDQIGITFS